MDRDFYCLHSELCKTLANDKRQMILDALRDGELSVSQLIERTRIPQANLSQHLALMRARGVVVSRREGQRVYYAIADERLIQAFDLITEVMLDAIERRAQTTAPADEDAARHGLRATPAGSRRGPGDLSPPAIGDRRASTVTAPIQQEESR